ncbi:MAG TPA: UXX-star (seleno)protein family 2 [Candidatus Krumholzibacteria bacterium]|nr:UXX-star (seleno)protein family 2 [Candidatus Krumholzibacteria bacterium]
MADRVILYTHPECDLCVTVKLELDEQGTPYDEIDLAKHPEKWAELEGWTNGERITPVRVEGGKVTIGYRGIGCAFYD